MQSISWVASGVPSAAAELTQEGFAMCLAIPGQVVERLPAEYALEYALVDFDGLRRRVCVSCVPDAQPGDYVIVHAGIAINRLDPDEAQQMLEELRRLGELTAAETEEP